MSRGRLWRPVAIAVAVVGATLAADAFAAPTSAAPAQRIAHAAATPACKTLELVIWLDTSGNGAAGSMYYNLQFTNLSGHTCHLYGLPGVSAVNLANRQIGLPASRRGHRTVVTLKKGATAKAVVQLVDVGALPSCHRVIAAGLRVYPPNQTKAKVVPFPFPACSNTNGPLLPVFMRVAPVTR